MGTNVGRNGVERQNLSRRAVDRRIPDRPRRKSWPFPTFDRGLWSSWGPAASSCGSCGLLGGWMVMWNQLTTILIATIAGRRPRSCARRSSVCWWRRSVCWSFSASSWVSRGLAGRAFRVRDGLSRSFGRCCRSRTSDLVRSGSRCAGHPPIFVRASVSDGAWWPRRDRRCRRPTAPMLGLMQTFARGVLVPGGPGPRLARVVEWTIQIRR
ncbi:MAG: hypothetical protein GIKADHBN_00942 [Phycisphaerales bacterium]|nr:hypothetical protein [Phycisphaerales bacterium]